MTDNFSLLEMLIAFSLGLLIGEAFGAVRIHFPLIRRFRDYYRRAAEERMSSIQSHGAAPTCQNSAVTGAAPRLGGQGARSSAGWVDEPERGSRIISLRAHRAPGKPSQSTKGGDANSLKTTNHTN